MAFKLKAEEAKKLVVLTADLEKKKDGVMEAIKAFNTKMEEEFEQVTDAVNAYNEEVEKVADFITDIGSAAREEYDDRSEAWLEGDRASDVDEWISSYESFEPEALAVEAPGEIDEPSFEAIDLLDELASEPNS